jgi:ribokinase
LSIIVVGSINMDMTLYLARWPERGETVTAKSTAIQLGGKGANQAIAAARLGAEVVMIGALGADDFGARARAELLGEGIALQAQCLAETATGIASIDVGPEGQNIIRLSPGANAALTAEMVRGQAKLFAGCKVLLLQNEIPLAASLAAAALARAAGAMVIMDPAPAPEVPWTAETLGMFDIVTPNLQEARLLAGLAVTDRADAADVVAALAQHSPRGAIVTMGKDGALWCIDGQIGRAPACRVAAIDTVAAGDCFNGALASALVRGMDLAEAVAFASRAAALATTRRGAAVSLPRLQEVNDFKPMGALV